VIKQNHTAKPPQKYCPQGMRSFAGQRRPAKIFDAAECMRIQLPPRPPRLSPPGIA
jgi:hypothetical protein